MPVPTTLPPLPTTSVPPLDQTLTYVQAVAQCTTQGVVDNPLTATNELANCANALLTPTSQPSNNPSRWRACASVVPGGLRRQPPLPGSSMASQKAAHSGR